MGVIIRYIVFLLCLYPCCVYGQGEICGSVYLTKKVIANNSSARKSLDSISVSAARISPTYRVDFDSAYPIPVIFHFILNSSQIAILGGEAGIIERLDSQMKIINRAFCGENLDKNKIPAPFQSVAGNAGIRFGLAHQSPQGRPCPGYEIVSTTKEGFELNGAYGSTFAYSDAKYSASFGADAWDPSTYLNVWVINPLDDGFASNLLSVTIPPSFVSAFSLPMNECGVIVHFGCLGYKTTMSEYFIYNRTSGATLIHELGHFFQIWHTWGDDDGLCPDNGGQDDGLSDTPPQANFSHGCPTFPFFDRCSPPDTEKSVMFMNYMDYSDDTCRCMFTKQQAHVMKSSLDILDGYFSLTKHPNALSYPDPDFNVQSQLDSFIIYPSPTSGFFNVFFYQTSTHLKRIQVLNEIGQSIFDKRISDQMSCYPIELTPNSNGVYIVYLYFDKSVSAKKIVKI